MKNNKLQRSVLIAGLVFTFAFGFIVLSATAANAQYRDDRQNDSQKNSQKDRRDDRNRNDRDRDDRDRDDDDDDDNEQYNDNRRNDGYENDRNNRSNYITQQAYREGMRQGAEDARSGYRANAQRAAGQAMRGMNNGNNSRWGNQRNVRQTYRDEFIRGYQEAYSRYDNRHNRRGNRDRRNGY